MADSGSLPNGITYQWNTDDCYTSTQFTGSNPECFPHGQTTQSVTGNDLSAEGAGTITCTVTISGSEYTSEPFTLHISGEQLVYCVITFIVYCKQYMLLYCHIIHRLLWFMYSGVFTIGVAVTRGNGLTMADALTDYSYVNIATAGVRLAHCLTRLGPSGNDYGVLGGLYFKGNMIPNRASCGTVNNLDIIQPRPADGVAGLIKIDQCEGVVFTTDNEGIYTCAMMSSFMMNQSIRFGIYHSVSRGVATIESTEAAASPKKRLPSSVSCASQLYNKSLLPIPRPI